MAKSPYSSAGGGNSDTNPHEFAARKRGGACYANGGPANAAHSAVEREAKSRKSPGIIEGEKGEDAPHRLDRKRGGAAHKGKAPKKGLPPFLKGKSK